MALASRRKLRMQASPLQIAFLGAEDHEDPTKS